MMNPSFADKDPLFVLVLLVIHLSIRIEVESKHTHGIAFIHSRKEFRVV